MPHCLSCGTEFKAKRNTLNKYCNNICQQIYQYKLYIDSWLAGNETGHVGKLFDLSNHVRRYMHDTFGTACSKCGWDEKHPVDSLPLTEIDHIDGDASNCTPSNLRVLCPNCHSMTPTFRARNKHSSRVR